MITSYDTIIPKLPITEFTVELLTIGDWLQSRKEQCLERQLEQARLESFDCRMQQNEPMFIGLHPLPASTHTSHTDAQICSQISEICRIICVSVVPSVQIAGNRLFFCA
jgi:hypothetical protein